MLKMKIDKRKASDNNVSKNGDVSPTGPSKPKKKNTSTPLKVYILVLKVILYRHLRTQKVVKSSLTLG